MQKARELDLIPDETADPADEVGAEGAPVAPIPQDTTPDNQRALEAKFDKKFIKKNPKGFDYVEGQVVIGRLIASTPPIKPLAWDFQVTHRDQMGDNLIVWGKLGALTEHGWIYRENVGGDKIQYRKNTDKSDIDNAVDPVKNWKAAETDCIKRCAMLFGVALHLYGATEADYEAFPEKAGKPEDKKPPVREKRVPPHPDDETEPDDDTKAAWEARTRLKEKKLMQATRKSQFQVREGTIGTRDLPDDLEGWKLYCTLLDGELENVPQ